MFVFYHRHYKTILPTDPTKPDLASIHRGIASLKLAALHTVPVPHPLAFPARPGKPNPRGLCSEGNWGNEAELLQGLRWPASLQPWGTAAWKILKT